MLRRVRIPSPAMVVACLALTIALSGAGYAAVALPRNSVGTVQLKRNAVAAPKIRNGAVTSPKIGANAVGSAHVQDGGIGSSDLADGGVGSADVADSAVAGADIADNAVAGSEIADNAVGTAEVANASLSAADFADNQLTPRAYARVQADGTLEPGADPTGGTAGEQNKAVDQADVQHPSAGTYCFGGLGFPVRTAMVSMDSAGAAATTDQIASVAIQRGANLGGCDADHQQARVNIFDVSAAALADARFTIWFER